MTSTRPAELLNKEAPESEVHIDNLPFVFTRADVRSKCGWSPYEGMEMRGRIDRVVVRGEDKVIDGQVVAEPGSGSLMLTAD